MGLVPTSDVKTFANRVIAYSTVQYSKLCVTVIFYFIIIYFYSFCSFVQYLVRIRASRIERYSTSTLPSEGTVPTWYRNVEERKTITGVDGYSTYGPSRIERNERKIT